LNPHSSILPKVKWIFYDRFSIELTGGRDAR
jgi:hypothetical protein